MSPLILRPKGPSNPRCIYQIQTNQRVKWENLVDIFQKNWHLGSKIDVGPKIIKILCLVMILVKYLSLAPSQLISNMEP